MERGGVLQGGKERAWDVGGEGADQTAAAPSENEGRRQQGPATNLERIKEQQKAEEEQEEQFPNTPLGA